MACRGCHDILLGFLYSVMPLTLCSIVVCWGSVRFERTRDPGDERGHSRELSCNEMMTTLCERAVHVFPDFQLVLLVDGESEMKGEFESLAIMMALTHQSYLRSWSESRQLNRGGRSPDAIYSHRVSHKRNTTHIPSTLEENE